MFTNLVGVSNIEVNAFQRLADVVIQKSIREGFGLVVSESLWKGTPVVARNAGGIPLQMADGTGGILVSGTTECAEATLSLLRDRERARALGVSGRERVRQHVLTPRLVLDHLRLMADVAVAHPIARPNDWSRHRDPVCGMTIGAGAVTAEYYDIEYGFC
ncbi:MAG TPA: glycosyltransferase [Acidimicrobiia bacterium]|nr:glycosyltransferase [Acidimicrobiia bacterium]